MKKNNLRSKSPLFNITPQNIHHYVRNKSPIVARRLQQKKKPQKSHKSYGLKENKLEIYKLIFNTFSNNKEYLNPAELRNIFNYLGIYTNKNEIFKVLCDYDTNETGYIDFEEFLNVVTDRCKPFENESKRKKKEIFNQLSSKKKIITAEDFEKSFFKHGFDCTKEEILEIYEFLKKKVDGTEDGIDFANFNKLLLEVNQGLKKNIKANQF